MHRDATISECGKYRYTLLRSWGDRHGSVVWIMLNPSTADADVDDPTIRRCMKFTERLGHETMVVVNLFALRATDPRELLEAEDSVGAENTESVLRVCDKGEILVAAWGATKKPIRSSIREIVKQIRDGYELKCLGTTKDGSPRHPLYLRGDAELIDWKGGA